MRDDEPAVIEGAHGEQVLRAALRSGDEVLTAQGRAGYREHGRLWRQRKHQLG